MGTWYVVAHVPYFTDRGHVAARDEYTLQPDGQITVHYTGLDRELFQLLDRAQSRALLAEALEVPAKGPLLATVGA